MQNVIQTISEPVYLTAGEFARAIGVSPRTVQRWDKGGELVPHHKSPKGTRYYTQEQVQEYLDKK